MEVLPERIGKVCLTFSTLELIISCFVSKLISDDAKIGAIMTAEMSFQNLVKTFSSLVNLKISEETEVIKLKQLISDINSIEQERNKIIHSVYVTNNYNKIFRIKATAKQGKGLKFTNEEVDEDYLKNVINRIVKVVKELEEIYRRIFNADVISYG